MLLIRANGPKRFLIQTLTQYPNSEFLGEVKSVFYVLRVYWKLIFIFFLNFDLGPFQLRVDLEDFKGQKYYAVYNYFRIGNETENYKLHVRGYHGNAGDSMTSVRDNHNGNMFSTHDRDNDRRGYNNCAQHFRGGWWYSDCYDSNLNGQYYPQGKHVNFFNRDGIHWKSINEMLSLKFVEMSVRPADDLSSENSL